MLKIYGIRHHGVGSCRRLERALIQNPPDIILLEGVEEADALLPFLKNIHDFEPPIAQLIYNPKDFKQAVYYPFTRFSPEWAAMQYAVANKIEIRHIDLPLGARFGLEQAAQIAAQSPNLQSPTPNPQFPNPQPLIPNPQPPTQDQRIQRDPIGYLAQLAGYSDGERWWEVMFEQVADDTEVFVGIQQMISTLREAYPLPEGSEDLLREAYMRAEIRKAIKAGYQSIAVVCGAYHTAALDLDKYPAKNDTALLKSLPKTKLQAAWIPWTYERIAVGEGYGAGVVSPAWYDFLYQNPQNASIHWLSKVAELFRQNGLDTSSAHIIEAVRLAQTLATLRGLQLPTLDELNESTLSVILGGDTEKLALIYKHLIIGQKLGRVPADTPRTPLQQDFESQLKTLKLSKYLTEKGWLKSSASAPKGGLDLRETHDREQSYFLHRLVLLGIAWARSEGGTGRELSTKNEYWYLDWKPEFMLLVIEASVWGASIETAVTQYLQNLLLQNPNLSRLSELLSSALKSNLPAAFEQILNRLQDTAALSKDASELMGTLPALVRIARYGDVRKTDTQLVDRLILELAPRVAILLPTACIHINEQVAKELYGQIISSHRALQLYQNPPILEAWYAALSEIAQFPNVAALLKGLCTRLLFDAGQWDTDKTAIWMEFALSKSQARLEAANWLEGFLFGSGLVLIYNQSLWEILNNWVAALNVADFEALLPLLRRAFSKFSQPEKEKILAKAQTLTSNTPKPHALYDLQRFELTLPILNTILN